MTVNTGGSLTVSGGSASLNATGTVSTDGTINLMSGTLNGSGSLSVGGTLNWSGGTHSGTGSTTIMGTGGILTISGNNSKTLDGRTIFNNGNAYWTDSGQWNVANGATFNNRTGAAFAIQNDTLLSASTGAVGTFNNLTGATLVKQVATGNTTWNISLVNSGTVTLNAGTLTLGNSGASHSTSTSISGTGSLALSGGTFTLQSGAGITTAGFTQSGGTTTVDTGAAVSATNYTLTGGILNGAGALTVTGALRWQGGNMEGTGTTKVDVGASATLNTTSAKTLNTRTFSNYGTTTWTDSGAITTLNGPTFNNQSGATFDIQNDATLSTSSGNALTFNNLSGATLTKSAGTGTSSFGAKLINNGTVNVNSGTLSVTQDGQSSSAINGTGTFVIAGGTFSITSGASFGAPVSHTGGTLGIPTGVTVSAGTYTLAGGTVSGEGTLSVTGTFTWTSGTLGGSGKTSVAATGTLSMSGTGTKVLNVRTLENNGSGSFTGAGALQMLNGGAFSNKGTFTIQNDITWQNTGGTPTVTNAAGATLIKNTATGTTSMAAAFTNNGTLTLTSGTLQIDGGGTLGGTVGGSGNLTLASAVTLNDGVSFAAPLAITNGTTTINSAASATAATFSMSGGTLDGGGTLTVSGSLAWSGGTMQGSGGKTIASSTATLALSGGSTKTLNARGFENNGAATWTGAGNLSFLNAATFSNKSGSSFTAQNDASVNNSGGADSTFTVAESATFTKNTTTGTTIFNVPLNLLGGATITSGSVTVNVATTVSASVTGTGGLTVNGGTTTLNSGAAFTAPLTLASGTITIPTGVTVSAATFNQTGGTLTGAGTLSVGGGTWSGGVMSGAGKTSINSSATFAISGANSKTLDTRTFENNGSTSWSSSGTLQAANGGTFDNRAGAFFTIQGDATLFGSGTTAFNNAAGATLTKNTTSGTTTFNIAFTHSGTANISTGTLALINTSTINTAIGGAGTLSVTSGTTTLNSGVVLSVPFSLGGGTVTIPVNATVGVGTFTMSNGTLNGGGTLTLTGSGTWSNGTMSGTGKTSVASGATLTVSSASAHILDNRTLENSGTLNWNGTGNIVTSNGAVVSNLTNANFNIQADNTLNYVSGAATALNNAAGAFITKFNSTGTTTIGIATTNAGTATATTGTLAFTGGYSQTSTTVSGGGLAIAAGATVTNNGGFSIGDGEVRGTGSVGSNLDVRSGVLRAVDITTSNTPGTLSVLGNLSLGSTATVKAYLAGTTAGSSTGYGRVVADSAVSLDGALKVETVGGFAPSSGQSFDVVTGSSMTGTFSSTDLPSLSSGLQWSVAYTGSAVRLTVSGTVSSGPAATGLTVSGTASYGGNATITATLKDAAGAGVAGKTITLGLTGVSSTVTGTTNANGVATGSISASGIAVGTQARAVSASWAGDTSYLASSANGDLVVSKASQTITFAQPTTPQTVGASFSVSGSASSGLTVSFGIDGGCTISGATVTIISTTACIITATQAGDTNYDAAPNVARTVSTSGITTHISAVSGTATYNSTATLTATLGAGPDGVAGKTIKFKLNNTNAGTAVTNAFGVASLSSVSISNAAAGSYTEAVTAEFDGDSTYASSAGLGTLTVSKAAQAITFTQPASPKVAGDTLSISATSDSGLAVTITATGGCSYSENQPLATALLLPRVFAAGTVTITDGTQTCTLTAAQTGNGNYNAASSVVRTIATSTQGATVSLVSGAGTYGSTGTLQATLKNGSGTGLSGRSIAFTINGAAVATVSTDSSGVASAANVNVALSGLTGGVNTGVLRAEFVGDSTFAASSATGDLTLAKATQTITFNLQTTLQTLNSTFTVSPSAGSGLTVTVTATGGCTISGNTVTMTSGSVACTLTAAQAGDGNYNAATSVTRTVSAQPLGTSMTAVSGSGAFASTATLTAKLVLAGGTEGVSSKSVAFTLGGAAVGFATTDTSGVATLAGVSLTGRDAGSVTGAVAATFAGDASHATSTASGDLTVTKASQAITFAQPTTPQLINAQFTIAPASSSGLTVSVAATGGCTVSSSTVTMTSATVACTLTANQAGSANYNAAETVVRTVATGALPTTLTSVSGSGAFGSTASLQATLTSSGQPVADKSVTFSLNSTVVGSATTNSSGVATLTGISLSAFNAGTQVGGVGASFAADTAYSSATATGDLTVAKATQTITFDQPATPQLINAQFTVAPGSSSGLAVTVTAGGGCTISGSTVTMTSATVACTLTAAQTGNGNYNTADNVLRIVSASALPTSFSAVSGEGAYKGAASLTATLTNSGIGVGGRTVSFTVNGVTTSGVTNNSGVATASVSVDGLDAGVKAGGVAVAFVGDTSYAAATGSGNLTVNQAAQTITFPQPQTPQLINSQFTLAPTADSGLTVTVGAGGGCTISGLTVTITSTTTCALTASQAGNANYLTATPVVRTVATTALPTSLGAVSGSGTYGGTATLTATLSNAGLPVAGKSVGFSVSNVSVGFATTNASGVASLSGVSLSGVNAGSSSNAITASFGGDTAYSASTANNGTLTVAKAAQTITFAPPATPQTVGNTFSVAPSASSGLTVTVSVSGGCSISGSTITLTSGTTACSITASQSGDGNYNAAPNVVQTVSTQPLSTALSQVSGTGPFGGTATFTATLTSNGQPVSGQPVSFKLNTTSVGSTNTNSSGVATLSGVNLTGFNAGTSAAAVSASFAGTSSFAAATLSGDLVVSQASQAISFVQPATPQLIGAIFTVEPTASSGLAVGVSASGGCTISGISVTMTSSTVACTLTASQAGNGNYAAAANVQRTVATSALPTTLAAVGGSGTYGSTGTLTATLTSNGAAVADKLVSFAIGNTTLGSATTSASGVVTLSGVSLTGVNAGSNSGAVKASFAGDTSYAAATATGGLSVAKATQTITFAQPPTPQQISTTFSVTASASSSLTVAISANGGCTIANSTVTMTSGTTACTLTASQSGDSNYLSADNIVRIVSASAQPTSLTTVSGSGTYGGNGTLTATLSSSGQALDGKSIVFKLNNVTVGNSNTNAAGTATLSGVNLAAVTAGVSNGAVSAAFSGDNAYAAVTATGNLTVAKAAQTITFAQPNSPQTVGATFTVSATASSSLTVAISAAGGCTLAAGTVTITSAGSDCTLTAAQPGDANYEAAPNVARSVVVNAVTTGVSAVAGTGTFGGTATLTATIKNNGAGLTGKTITFKLSGTVAGTATTDASGVATLTGVSLSGVNAGTITNAVSAGFAGDSTFGASSADGNLVVAKADQTITFAQPTTPQTVNATFTVAPTASSGLTVAVQAGGQCTIANGTVTVTSSGVCTLTANQSGNSNYNAAASVTRTVGTGTSTTTLDTVSGLGSFRGTAILTASLRSAGAPVAGRTITFASGNTNLGSQTTNVDGVVTLTGVSVTNFAVGSFPITATFAGDGTYTSSTGSGTLTIEKGAQTITFAPPVSPQAVGATFTVAPTASSSLAVTVTASGACTLAGSTVTLSAPGLCTLTGNQAGDTNFEAAATVTRTVTAALPVLFKSEGDGQTDLAGRTLNRPFTVSLNDPLGAPLSGRTITWAITSTPTGSSGQALSAATSTTGSNGRAQVTFTLGTGLGDYTVTAGADLDNSGTIDATERVTFVARAVSGATKLLVVAGSGQNVPVSQIARTSLTVQAVNDNGQAVPNVPVTFSVTNAPGGASGQAVIVGSTRATSAGSTTDSSGQAAARFAAGGTAGAYTVTASVTGLAPVTFTETALPTFTLRGSVRGVDILGAPLTPAAGSASYPAVSGASVQLSQSEFGLNTTVATDSTGAFSVTMVAGQGVLRVRADGFNGADDLSVSFNQAGDQSPATLSVQLVKFGQTIAGTVRRSDNTALPRAFVAASQVTAGGATLPGSARVETTAAADGSFTLAVPGSTSWRLTAFDANLGARTREAVVTVACSPTSTATCDANGNALGRDIVYPTAVTVTGTVRVNGLPVDGANVVAQQQGGVTGGSASTNASGAFSLSLPVPTAGDPTAFVIRAQTQVAGELAPRLLKVSTAGDCLNAADANTACAANFSAQSGGLAIEFVDGAGNAVAVGQTVVSATGSTVLAGTSVSGPFNSTSLSGASRATMNLMASDSAAEPAITGETYQVRVNVDGFGELLSAPLTLPCTTSASGITCDGAGNAAARVTVPVPFTVSGTVVERTGASTTPAVGAAVAITAGNVSASTTTGQGGEFTVTIPGRAVDATLNVSKTGFLPVTQTVSVSGNVTGVSVTLISAATQQPITGTVSGPAAGQPVTVTAVNLSTGATVSVERGATGAGCDTSLVTGPTAFCIPVGTGQWRVRAVADGFRHLSTSTDPVVVTAGAAPAAVVVTMTPVATFDPQAGQCVDTLTCRVEGALPGGGSITLVIPANAAGSTGNVITASINVTTNAPETGVFRPVLKTAAGDPFAIDIRVVDASGNRITQFTSPITIRVVTTVTDGLFGFFDPASSNWVGITFTKDATGFTLGTDHLTKFTVFSKFTVFADGGAAPSSGPTGGGSSSNGSGAAPGTPNGPKGPAPQTASRKVNPAQGGSVSLNQVEITLPAQPGASGDLTATIDQVDLNGSGLTGVDRVQGVPVSAPLPDQYALGSSAFRLALTDSTGAAVTLNRPLTIKLQYNDNDQKLAGGDLGSLRVLRWDAGANRWTELATTLNTNQAVVTADSLTGGVFSLAIALPSPELAGPADGAFSFDLAPLLSWRNPAGVTQYHLQVTPANNDGPGIDLIIGDSSATAAVGAFQVRPPVLGQGNYVLLPGMTYTWRVRISRSASGLEAASAGWGPWAAGTFRTASTSSTLISPLGPATGSTVDSLTPTLRWDNNARTVFYYEVQVSKDAEFGPNAFLYSELRHGGVSNPLNSYTVPAAFPLEPGITYFWRVRPRIQGDGVPVPWSDVWSFRTPG